LTNDHTLVAELVRRGELSPGEAQVHPQRSVITRALGTDPDVDVDTFVVPEQDGDIFLICSDGLTTMIGDDTIERVVAEHGADLEGAAEELVRLANKAGGEDNITVVAFEVSASLPEPDERTLEQTQPMPVVLPDVPPEQALEPAKKPKRSFWPLLLLLLVIAAAAVALWLVAR
jgi:serine/threonine protein phosphatase PrpC